jgi:hypothetical protein
MSLLIASTIFAFLSMGAVAASASLIQFNMRNKVKRLQEIGDSENLRNFSKNITVVLILSWFAVAIALITAITIIVGKYYKWPAILMMLGTFGLLIGAMVVLVVQIRNNLTLINEAAYNELQGIYLWAMVTNGISMGFMLISLILYILAKEPEVDIFKENKYKGGVYQAQTKEDLTF